VPWTCQACRREAIGDDAPECPSCKAQKSAWTVHDGQTRTMQVALGRERLEALVHTSSHASSHAPSQASSEDAPRRSRRGSPHAEAPQPVAGGGRPGAQATVAWSLPRRLALDLMARKASPADGHQLTVRRFTKKGADPRLEVVVLFDAAEAVKHEVHAGSPDGTESGTDVCRLVLVHGPGPAVSFPGLHVLDVSEDGARHADAWARAIVISAGRKKLELPVQAVPTLGLRLLDERGEALGGATCRLEAGGETWSAVTDSRGELLLQVAAGLERGRLTVDLGHGHESAFEVTIGALAAPSTPAGARARLNNLGHSLTPPDADPAPALRAFRRAQGLVPLPADDAQLLDAATSARLEAAHDRLAPVANPDRGDRPAVTRGAP
jgi:hypothetical protein